MSQPSFVNCRLCSWYEYECVLEVTSWIPFVVPPTPKPEEPNRSFKFCLIRRQIHKNLLPSYDSLTDQLTQMVDCFPIDQPISESPVFSGKAERVRWAKYCHRTGKEAVIKEAKTELLTSCISQSAWKRFVLKMPMTFSMAIRSSASLGRWSSAWYSSSNSNALCASANKKVVFWANSLTHLISWSAFLRKPDVNWAIC